MVITYVYFLTEGGTQAKKNVVNTI